jgi:hypothetical protein
MKETNFNQTELYSLRMVAGRVVTNLPSADWFTEFFTRIRRITRIAGVGYERKEFQLERTR